MAKRYVLPFYDIKGTPFNIEIEGLNTTRFVFWLFRNESGEGLIK